MLPVKTFSLKCSSNTDKSDLCPACKQFMEMEDHFLLFIPAYRNLRKIWIAPVYQNLGVRHYRETLRILKADTDVADTDLFLDFLDFYIKHGLWKISLFLQIWDSLVTDWAHTSLWNFICIFNFFNIGQLESVCILNFMAELMNFSVCFDVFVCLMRLSTK